MSADEKARSDSVRMLPSELRLRLSAVAESSSGALIPVGLPSAQQLLVAEKDQNGKVTTKEIMPVLFSLLEGSEQAAFRAS